MKFVTFQFAHSGDLKGFLSVVKGSFWELHRDKYILECSCTDAEIELAVNAFNARVVSIDGSTRAVQFLKY